MKAVLCPVCNGTGEATPNLDAIDPNYKVTCHGCSGKGYLWSPEGVYGDYTPYTDKCPVCGGDMRSPGRTGCPEGSHFGSYGSV